MDPDGRRDLTVEEIDFIYEILGNDGLAVTDNLSVKMAPKDRAGSMIWHTIYLERSVYVDSLKTSRGKNDLIHETFHQVQFMFNSAIPSIIPLVGIGESAWDKLGMEQLLFATGFDVYSFGDYRDYDISIYSCLNDIPFLEAQAQLVGNYAQLYDNAKNGIKLSEKEKKALKKSAEILNNSGFEESESVKWVLENY